MHHARDLKIPFEVVDKITGKALGRPKSGTFRTADVVGLDTLGPWASLYETPDYIAKMIEEGALGAKTRKGIYINKGKQVFSPEAGDYVDANNTMDDALVATLKGKDWADNFAALGARDVDFAIRWGFGWKQGPFELMQLIGWKNVVAAIEKGQKDGELLASVDLPKWAKNIDAVHNTEGSYSPAAAKYIGLRDKPVYERQARRENVIGSDMPHIRKMGTTIFENDSACKALSKPVKNQNAVMEP